MSHLVQFWPNRTSVLTYTLSMTTGHPENISPAPLDTPKTDVGNDKPTCGLQVLSGENPVSGL